MYDGRMQEDRTASDTSDRRLYVREHPGIGRVFLAPLDLLFTKWDIVEPDLLFIAGDQLEILTDKNVQGPPALVDGSFPRTAELSRERADVLNTGLLPGLTIRLNELFD